MHKLVQTNFVYKCKNHPEYSGSYLGRKPASEATIRRNMRKNGTPRTLGRIEYIKVGTSHVTNWIE